MRIAWAALLAAFCAFGAHRLGFVVQVPGTSWDSVSGMVRDAQGNLILVGTTSSHDFPATVGQTRRGGSSLLLQRKGVTIPLAAPNPNALACLASDPRRPGTLFAAFGSEFYTSEDYGASWLRRHDFGSLGCTGLTVSPHNRDTIFAGFYGEGLFRSRDGGKTWARVGPPGLQRAFADPNHDSVWISSSHRTTDGGDTWEPIDIQASNFAFDPTRPGWVIATAGIHNPGPWRSTNSGRTWTRLAPVNGTTAEFIYDMATSQGTLYAAGSRLFRSRDFGDTWESFARPGYFWRLQVDPRTSYLYAQSESGPYRSDDRGETWTKIGDGGFEHRAHLELMPDREDPLGEPLIFGGGLPDSDAFVMKYSPRGEMLWSTLIGGLGSDSAAAIAVDAQGGIYVAGTSSSANFPYTAQLHDFFGSPSGAFLAKLAADGSRLEYAARVAGPLSGYTALAVNSRGAAYVAGISPGPPPVRIPPGGAPREIPGVPAYYGFLARLNPTGTAFEFARGVEGEQPAAIAIDKDDNAWMGGYYISTIDEGGSWRPVATGFAYGRIRAMTFDSEGRLHLTGLTNERQLATTPGAFQREVPTYGPAIYTGFAAVYDPRAGRMVYSTYLSGEAPDTAHAIAVDAGGNTLIAGDTRSRAFPLRQAIQGAFAEQTGFVTKLNRDGSDVLMSTFAGDDRRFAIHGVAAGAEGEVYFAGHTLAGPDFQPQDIFLVKLEPQPGPPVLRLDAVLNAASRDAAPVAPGSLLALTGDEFNESARVLIGDREVPILSRNWREMVVRSPDDLEPGTVISVRVTTDQGTTQTIVMPTARVSPGVYTVDNLGYDFALAWNADSTQNSRDNPATLGSELTVAVNGLRPDVPFRIFASPYVYSPGPLQVLAVDYADTTRVRFRLPQRTEDFGSFLLTIVTEERYSRPVPVHLR